MIATAAAEAFIVDAPGRLVKRNLHATELPHPFVESVFHLLGNLLMGGIVGQIYGFVRVALEVVQFVVVPEAVVGDVFVLVGAQRKGGGRLQKILFPVIHVEEIAAPRNSFASACGRKLSPSMCAGLFSPIASITVGATSMLPTIWVTTVPPLMSAGHCTSNGTRMDGSYVTRLSIRPCETRLAWLPGCCHAASVVLVSRLVMRRLPSVLVGLDCSGSSKKV